jgi:pimeloyl-ACP methyl ester carboxylesterase
MTSCDAFENYPPPNLKPLFTAANWPPAFQAALQALRIPDRRGAGIRRLAHADVGYLVTEWRRPVLSDHMIREDLRRFTVSISRQTVVFAAKRLPEFTRPALIAWSEDDGFFPLEDGRRLAAALPNSQLEMIGQAWTF